MTYNLLLLKKNKITQWPPKKLKKISELYMPIISAETQARKDKKGLERETMKFSQKNQTIFSFNWRSR